MRLKEIYKMFPTEDSAYRHLEEVRWGDKAVCPYCTSTASTFIPKENRFRCNACDVSYSVTVGTIFHRTRLDLRKWFLALDLILHSTPKYSARQLGRDIEATKDTAVLILKRVRSSFIKESAFFNKIIDFNNNSHGKK